MPCLLQSRVSQEELETSVLARATKTSRRSFFLPLPFWEGERRLSTPGMPENASNRNFPKDPSALDNEYPACRNHCRWAAPCIQWNRKALPLLAIIRQHSTKGDYTHTTSRGPTREGWSVWRQGRLFLPSRCLSRGLITVFINLKV